MSLHQDKDWLYQKYWVEGLDCVQIGKIANRDPGTIHYWMKKHNLATRPRGSNWNTNLSKGRGFGWRHTDEAKEKVSKASRERNQVPYLKNGKHWLKSAKPEDNPKWRGGITPERQTFYRSEEWKEAVKTIWKRDNAICQRCGLDHRTLNRKKARKFHIHHIVSFEVKELRADVDNLILLCHSCHMWIHSRKNTKKEFIKTYDEFRSN